MSSRLGVKMVPKVEVEDPSPRFSPHRPPKITSNQPRSTLSIYDFLFFNQPWRREAICTSADADLFFPDQGVPNARARALCDACPVIIECLDFAISNGERFGVWGGLTAEERGDVVYLMNSRGVTLEEASAQIRGMRRKVRRRLRMTFFTEGEEAGLVS